MSTKMPVGEDNAAQAAVDALKGGVERAAIPDKHAIVKKAKAILADVKKALAEGVEHFDPDTKELLDTPEKILQCMLAKKRVDLKHPQPKAE